MRRLLAPSRPVGLLWAWPLRLAPLVVLGLGFLGWGLVTEPDNPWNDLVVVLVLMGCVLVLAFGLFVGVVAWLALRRWRDRPETAGSVTGVVTGVPLVGTGLVAGSGSELLGWALTGFVVALVVGLLTRRDARRLGAPSEQA